MLRRRAPGCLVVAVALLAPVPATAATSLWTSNGAPVCTAANDQYFESLIPDGAGGAYLGWYDGRAGGGTYVPYVQHLGSDGGVAAGWPADGLALSTGTIPAIDLSNVIRTRVQLATDGLGGVFAAWLIETNGQPNVYAQHLLANGSLAAGWPANGLSLGFQVIAQYRPQIVPDGQGGVYVIWEYQVAGTDRVAGQRVHANGTIASGWSGTGLFLVDTKAEDGEPVAIPDGAGGIVLAWTDHRGSNDDIYALRFDADAETHAGWAATGMPVCTSPGNQGNPHLATDGDGGTYVAWDFLDVSDADPFVTYVTDAGTIPPGWPAAGRKLAGSGDPEQIAGLAEDGVGGVFAVWGDINGDHVVQLKFDGTLEAGWTPAGVTIPGAIGLVPPVADGLGGMLMAWSANGGTTSFDVVATRITADGTVATGWNPGGTPVSAAPGAQVYPRIVPDGSGGAIIAWDDRRRSPADPADVYAARISADGLVPARLSFVRAEFEPGCVRLLWWGSDAARGGPWRVMRTSAGAAWAAIGDATAEASGSIRFDDTSVRPGVRYGYRLALGDAGAGDAGDADAWVVVPAVALSIRPLRNPSRDGVEVAYTLPVAETATLELLDVTGRRWVTRRIGGNAGDGIERLAGPRALRPGVYFVRLEQSGLARTVRLVVID